MRGNVIWSVKEVVDILLARQKNEFDGNVAVVGDRGNGKSTLVTKVFYRFPGYKPWVHQVYTRDDVIKLLKEQTYGLCQDDEAINSGYKREFQNKGQQELIKILTAYRDNYNIMASAVPNFFSLDKDLRDLFFLMLHVIEKGVAVVHMPVQGTLYSQDRWDAKNNAKIEEKWAAKIKKDPTFKFPYHKLSTFRGYLYFGDLQPVQKALYREIKKIKKEPAFKTETTESALPFADKVFNLLKEGKLSQEGLIQLCIYNNEKYNNIVAGLNYRLRNEGDRKSTGDYFVNTKSRKKESTKSFDEINQLVPTFP